MLKLIHEKFFDTTLRRKLVFLIGGVVTITPTILVTIFALTYYLLGIDKLFDEKIANAISETVKVAELYLQEHKKNIRSDILQVATDINKNFFILSENPELFNEFLDEQAQFRNLSELVVFTHNGVVGKNAFSFSLTFEKLPIKDMEIADSGEIALISTDKDDRVRAIVKLENFHNTYLLVGRFIDPDIINHL